MGGLTAGPRPDITPPQIVAMLVAGIPIIAQLLHAFGIYDLSIEAQQALGNVVTWAGVLGASLIGGDAVLRTGRNLRRGQVEAQLAAGGEGDKLEIVQSAMSGNVVTTVPSEVPSDTTTGFEKTP
jgi:hypothetical protein